MEIHNWISAAQYCLGLLEDRIPSAVADFRRLREVLEFPVPDGEEDASSKSAYVPEVVDRDTGIPMDAGVLLDFRFDHLAQMNHILRFAANKIEIEGLPESDVCPGEEPIGKRLLAARLRAGHTQDEAADAVECDAKDISEWENGKREPYPKSRKRIQKYIDENGAK